MKLYPPTIAFVPEDFERVIPDLHYGHFFSNNFELRQKAAALANAKSEKMALALKTVLDGLAEIADNPHCLDDRTYCGMADKLRDRIEAILKGDAIV